jgi:hypothetical protein
MRFCSMRTLGPDLTWRAEVGQQDRGRTDVEACAADGKPVVKIEAKLGAALGEGRTEQIASRDFTGILNRNQDSRAKITKSKVAAPNETDALLLLWVRAEIQSAPWVFRAVPITDVCLFQTK